MPSRTYGPCQALYQAVAIQHGMHGGGRYFDCVRQSSQQARQQSAGKDDGALQAHYHKTVADANDEKSKMVDARRQLQRFCAPVNDERELFDEFIFLAGRGAVPNTWETLTEMRH